MPYNTHISKDTMQRITFVQLPCPYTGRLLSADVLEGEPYEYYSQTLYPFDDEIMGPFGSIREVKEYLWSLYGRP
jgi:hypothetical protein